MKEKEERKKTKVLGWMAVRQKEPKRQNRRTKRAGVGLLSVGCAALANATRAWWTRPPDRAGML